MNKKPDEAKLIDYLYGELTGDERAEVARYIQENPQEQARLDGLGMTRKALEGLPDKEVIAPSFIFGEESNHRPIWRESYFRFSVGIAAAFLVVMISARLIGLNISYKESELRIGFGTPVQQTPALTAEQVSDMINSSVTRNNEVLQASWQENKASLEQSITDNMAKNSSRIDKLMKVASAANEKQIKGFVAQTQKENLKLMKDYMQLSSTGQKEYLEGLLVDFSKYLQEQRKQDLQFFQARMTNIEQNTDQFKQETEQLLTSLISSTGTNNQKRN